MNEIKDFPHMFMRTAPYLILRQLDCFLQTPNPRMSKRKRVGQRYYWYGSRISRETGVTYSHAHHLLQTMITEGLVRSKKVGRITAYELTNKGQLCLYNMTRLVNLFKYNNSYFENNGKVSNHDGNGNKSN